MDPTRDTASDLDRQRQELRGHARLHWLHWTIVAGSVLVTGIAWHVSNGLLNERTLHRFESEAQETVSLVLERLRHYEDALLGGVAMTQSNGGELSRERWRRYAAMLSLEKRYPGVNGIGVIRHVDSTGLEALRARMREEHPEFEVYPEHPFESHLPIVYVEPEASNAPAIGLDVAFERHRREAALRAMTTRTTQISGPIVLVQDSGRTPGFLFYAPFYLDPAAAKDVPVDRFATVEPDFAGFVYAPLVVRDLIAGVLDRRPREVTLAIRDAGTTLHEEAVPAGSSIAGLAFERDVEVYGRTWRFEIRPAAGFGADLGSHQPLTVLVCGLSIDAMLLVLFLLMAGSNRRVLGLAEGMTDRLRAANDRLEHFAHAASHDLKVPLRNVADVVGFLEEDLEGYLDSPGADPEVRRHLDAIRHQTERGASLVDGVLQYSTADLDEERRALVDTRALIEEIREGAGLAPERLELRGEFPVFSTQAVRFGQVLQNLIGNAVKYHHDPDAARIHIGVVRGERYYRFEVEDDGPGIEPRFHERIFDAFASLDTRPGADGHGIGLSIVKKSVESLGGTVTVDSEPGRGSIFRFDWPVAAAGAVPDGG